MKLFFCEFDPLIFVSPGKIFKTLDRQNNIPNAIIFLEWNEILIHLQI